MVAQPNANLRESGVKAAHCIDQDVEDQILGRRDMDFLWPGRGIETFGQLAGAFEKGQRVRQEQPALLRQWLRAPHAAALAIQFDMEAFFQGEQTVTQTLLGYVQYRRRP